MLVQQDITRGRDMVDSLFQGAVSSGTHNPVMTSQDYLSQVCEGTAASSPLLTIRMHSFRMYVLIIAGLEEILKPCVVSLLV